MVDAESGGTKELAWWLERRTIAVKTKDVKQNCAMGIVRDVMIQLVML